MMRLTPRSPLFPNTTLFRSGGVRNRPRNHRQSLGELGVAAHYRSVVGNSPNRPVVTGRGSAERLVGGVALARIGVNVRKSSRAGDRWRLMVHDRYVLSAGIH